MWNPSPGSRPIWGPRLRLVPGFAAFLLTDVRLFVFGFAVAPEAKRPEVRAKREGVLASLKKATNRAWAYFNRDRISRAVAKFIADRADHPLPPSPLRIQTASAPMVRPVVKLPNLEQKAAESLRRKAEKVEREKAAAAEAEEKRAADERAAKAKEIEEEAAAVAKESEERLRKEEEARLWAEKEQLEREGRADTPAVGATEMPLPSSLMPPPPSKAPVPTPKQLGREGALAVVGDAAKKRKEKEEEERRSGGRDSRGRSSEGKDHRSSGSDSGRKSSRDSSSDSRKRSSSPSGGPAKRSRVEESRPSSQGRPDERRDSSQRRPEEKRSSDQRRSEPQGPKDKGPLVSSQLATPALPPSSAGLAMSFANLPELVTGDDRAAAVRFCEGAQLADRPPRPEKFLLKSATYDNFCGRFSESLGLVNRLRLEYEAELAKVKLELGIKRQELRIEEGKSSGAAQKAVDFEFKLKAVTKVAEELMVKKTALETSWQQMHEKLRASEESSSKKIAELMERLEKAQSTADDTFNKLQKVRGEAELAEEKAEASLEEAKKKCSDLEWRYELASKSHQETVARLQTQIDRAARKASRKARREAAAKYKVRFQKIERAVKDAQLVQDNALLQSQAHARAEFIDKIKEGRASGAEPDLDTEKKTMILALESFDEDLKEMDIVELDLEQDLRVSPVSESSEGSSLVGRATTVPASSEVEVSSSAAGIPAAPVNESLPPPSLQVDQFGSNVTDITPSIASELAVPQTQLEEPVGRPPVAQDP